MKEMYITTALKPQTLSWIADVCMVYVRVYMNKLRGPRLIVMGWNTLLVDRPYVFSSLENTIPLYRPDQI